MDMKPLSQMSDEEVMNMPLDAFDNIPVEPDGEAEGVSPDAEAGGVTETEAGSDDPGSVSENPGDSEANPDIEAGGAADAGEVDDETGESDQASAQEEDSEDSTLTSAASEDVTRDDQSQATDESDAAEQDDDESDVDYRAEYEKLTQPFKAAKRMVSVGNVEDARRLMQKGIDYSRKMETIKPHMRVLRALEKAELLDPNRINFLIDLDQKKPEAIKKLLKDADIDPLSVDLEGSGDYSPTDHTPGDAEMAVRDVLENIQHSPKFAETVELITKGLDTKSRKLLQESPETIATLNEHIETGLYDLVRNRVENERLLGKLPPGLSDLEAYYQVGDAMYRAGEFKNLEVNSDTSSTPAESSEAPAQGSGSGAKANAKANLRNRKRAASPPKGKAVKGGKQVPDFSSMSDEEFEKALEGIDIASL